MLASILFLKYVLLNGSILIKLDNLVNQHVLTLKPIEYNIFVGWDHLDAW